MDGIRMVRTATLDVAVIEHGSASGPPLVLLHGYPDDPRCYDRVVAELASDGFRILLPYLRGYGPTRFRHASTPRSGQQAALGSDLHELLEALELDRVILGGMDWGGRAACVVSALWPARVRGLVTCNGYTIQDLSTAAHPADPAQAVRTWYQWYFNTARGHRALAEDPAGIARQCWRLWSPSMVPDEADFAATAASWRNPDHADVVAHSYRHRHGEAAGDPALEEIERALLAQPRITVPTIVLDPTEDGVHPMPEDDRSSAHFGPVYERRRIDRAGHFLPRERPDAFAAGVRDMARCTP